jgi:hypothetical protein
VLTRLADTSVLYADRYRRLGIDAAHVPYGWSPRWQGEGEVPKDIDVLWIGAQATGRRRALLARLRRDLAAEGVDLYVVDNEERPFVWGAERNRLFMRSKIVLNLMRAPHDDNSLRLFLAGSNGCAIVSEPMRGHGCGLEPGRHYVEAPPRQLASVMLRYLRDDHARNELALACREALTTKFTLERSMALLLAYGKAGTAHPASASADPQL